ncbi:MAG: S41 family peptidase [Dysgonamonadaceae bacterium]|jgi:carboxyl-terminal processing protease|nr:S41 family peptidase [Dysgonamonadaceae bacterium]
MKKILLVNIFALLSVVASAQLTEKEQFDIAKNLDVYNALFKELTMFYVDSIPPEKTIEENIYMMLKRLDPYTEYIPGKDLQNFMVQITGEYGGIGSVITSDSSKVIISEPYAGMPAAEAGLQAGDILLEINGESLAGKNSQFASERLKGQPNTPLKLKIQRPGEKKPREISLVRQRIEINPVTYYTALPGNIGYLYLSDFTTHSAKNVRAAVDDLRKNKAVKALIIDVRDNGGGVVEDCLDILNYFIPKGKLLLTMKGKSQRLDRVYRASEAAVDTIIPIAVLVNGQSASASEILAGAIQDLDRGIVVGERTYGKGLVQSSRELPYGGQLKLTTAKYYIPSGRCIQAIDYSNRSENGYAATIPDSLTSVFYTSKGRPVRDGGGVAPDYKVDEQDMPTMLYYLRAYNIFFDFVVQWRIKHPSIAAPEEFALPEGTYDEFKDFVKSRNFNYDRQSERALKNLKDIMEFEGYMKSASDEFKALENRLKPDLDNDLEAYRPQISDLLAREIMKQYYLAKGEMIYSLREDAVLDKAIEILSDKAKYEETFVKPED